MNRSFFLLSSQNSGATLLRSPLALLASVKSRRTHVVSAKIVKILDLENPDDPVFTGERFLHCRQLRTFRWKSDTTDTVDRLAVLEEGVVVVVRHFVPVDHS